MTPSSNGEEDDADIVQLRGITTVFDGVFPVVTVGRRGKPRALVNRQPKWSRVRQVHYIVGGTLDRLSVYEGFGTGNIKAVVRQLGQRQRDIQCDDCVRLHRPTNRKCSATLGIDTFARQQGVLYDFVTKKPAGRWRRTAQEIGGRERVGTCEYSRY